MMQVSLVKVLILIVLGLIVVALGTALYNLFRGRDGARNTVQALTVRVVLSFGLFLLLLIAGLLGYIRPHGL